MTESQGHNDKGGKPDNDRKIKHENDSPLYVVPLLVK